VQQFEPSGDVAALRSRVVVAIRGGDCPFPDADRADNWTYSRLQDDATLGDKQSEAFGRTCVYESDGAPAAPFALMDEIGPYDVVDLGNGARAGFDHFALAPSGISVDGMIDGFVERTKLGAGVPLDRPFPLQRPTRLVLLDTSPTAEAGSDPLNAPYLQRPGRDPHGFYLSHLAKWMLCTGQECAADIRTRQVMSFDRSPHGERDEDIPEKGAWGTLIDLARGIEAELDGLSSASNGGSGVVMNLSLGWHPYFGGAPSDFVEFLRPGDMTDRRKRNTSRKPFDWSSFDLQRLPPDVQAVYRAIARARCMGVLVVTAAGNHSGGPKGRRGPLLPAAWQAVPSDAVPECGALVPSPQVPKPFPLVYAVGGVESSGRDLVVSRPDSRPHFVAYGDHAIAPEVRRYVDEPLPLTGTSVGSLVVASAASYIWSVKPDLTADQVMYVLYDSAEEAGEVEGVFLPPERLSEAPTTLTAGISTAARLATPAVVRERGSRQVRYCRIVSRLTGEEACPEQKRVADLPRLVLEGDEVDGRGTYPDPATTNEAVCSTRQLHMRASDEDVAASNPCPDRQFYSPQVSPWTFPQPSTHHCPFCFLDIRQGILWIQLDGVRSMDSLTVVVKTSSEQESSFSVPDRHLGDGSPVTIKFDPSVLPANIISASLTAVRNERSVTMPIKVVPEPQ
jgi:hypothetical protein